MTRKDWVWAETTGLKVSDQYHHVKRLARQMDKHAQKIGGQTQLKKFLLVTIGNDYNTPLYQ